MLEVFRGVSTSWDLERARIEENDKRVCDMLNICPRMRRVKHWDLDPTHAITLAKEGDRVVLRVKVVDGTGASFTSHIFPRVTQRY